MDQTIRLTGGFESYKKAVNEGFTTNLYNPTLMYSAKHGFYIYPGSLLNEDHDACLGECHYIANGKKNFGTSYHSYLLVKSKVIKLLYGVDKEIEFDKEYELGKYSEN